MDVKRSRPLPHYISDLFLLVIFSCCRLPSLKGATSMKARFHFFLFAGALLMTSCDAAPDSARKEEEASLKACAQMVLDGFRKIGNTRDERFQGKVQEATALCRGGQKALQFRNTPWVDWTQYWGA